MNKSNEKSDSIRKEGNQFFSQKCFYKAMLKYNESLCLAEPSSEMLGLAYANRSAIYFEVKLFDKCLRNISFAKQHHYPEKNIDILNKRESKCLASLKQTSDDKASSDLQNFFKLSYPSHEKHSFMIDCLELKQNTTYGRHIVTNKSLKVGDIVAIEEPFCKIVHNRFSHQICSWCFNGNLMDLIPCHTCTKAMFCSEECKAKAFKSFHKNECPLVEMISILTPTLQMALRTFFTTLSIFNESLEDLRKYLLEHSKSYTVFDFESNDPLEHKFLAINSLITSEETEVEKEIFKEIFQNSPTLKEMWMSHGDFIAHFLKHQTQIGTLNYHEIYIWPLKKGRLQDNDVDQFNGSLAYQRGTIAAGNGSYPFCSLLNHHCAPNISRIFIKDKIALVVQRPIKKGDQLFDNYRYNFTNVSKEDRQSELSRQYRFKCNCDACTNDWPILSALKICDKMCFNKAKKVCRELNLADLNRKKAIVKYIELCEIIDRNQKNFPSLEICSIMQSAAAYLEMILKPQFQFS